MNIIDHKLQKSDLPNYWICTNLTHKLVTLFEHKNLSKTQKWVFLNDETILASTAGDVKQLKEEVNEWLKNNHSEKL